MRLGNPVYHYFAIDQYGYNKVRTYNELVKHLSTAENRLQLGQKKAMSLIKFHSFTGVLNRS